MPYAPQIAASLSYLASDAAAAALAVDAYWPKWDSPWWHMLLLHELGLTAKIPAQAIRQHVAALGRLGLKTFPIHPGDLPAGVDPYTGCPCHCQLGTVYQVLATWGVDVDRELPWIRPWLLSYQMADGGMSCDNDAYLVHDECPSSMVGTISAFEAILLHTPRPWTPAERLFLDRAAGFLVGRELRLGSSTRHNADERASAASWKELCFPRFYLYDVLRGLSALTLWAEKTGAGLPAGSVDDVVTHLEAAHGDGPVRLGRRSFADVQTTVIPASGAHARTRGPVTMFALLEGVSAVGSDSLALTGQWADTRARLSRLASRSRPQRP